MLSDADDTCDKSISHLDSQLLNFRNTIKLGHNISVIFE